MKNRLLRKGLAGMLTVMLVAGLLLGVGSKPMEAQAKSSTPKQEREVKDINLKDTDGNIPGISDPEKPKDANSEWKGSKVYFGCSIGDFIEFRVLDANTTDYNASPTMFLNSDKGVYISNTFAYDKENSNKWEDSDLKGWLNKGDHDTDFLGGGRR
ncbi:hypothetical protein NE619_03215 [Anaerovorax odorimutans]|uniref:Uncharacterized protein n=1 Tax=Anaerovorax odorimutans TaxID=109327 RepID=A0ABT1RKL8_9FIRM|nr:hypothetical protein [Anaerovorax odorimutans]MCQ4635727.1 hypothetical protein [Anaerovorax odorimutans]